MAIDHHFFDVLKKQHEMEEISTAPTMKMLLNIASTVPLESPWDFIS